MGFDNTYQRDVDSKATRKMVMPIPGAGSTRVKGNGDMENVSDITVYWTQSQSKSKTNEFTIKDDCFKLEPAKQ